MSPAGLDNFTGVCSTEPTPELRVPNRRAPIILPLSLSPLDRKEHAIIGQHSLKLQQDFVPQILFNNVLKNGDGEDGVEALIAKEFEIFRKTKGNIWQMKENCSAFGTFINILC